MKNKKSLKDKKIKTGGLEQRIFNLCLGVIGLMCAGFAAVLIWQMSAFTQVVTDASEKQRESIQNISSSTMSIVATESLANNARLEALAIDLIIRNANETGKTIDANSFDELKYDRSRREDLIILDTQGHITYSTDESVDCFAAGDSDVRDSSYPQFAEFTRKALEGESTTAVVEIGDRSFYMASAYIPSVGYSLITALDVELANTSTRDMLENYDRVLEEARTVSKENLARSQTTILVLLLVIMVISLYTALKLGNRIVKPMNVMMDEITNFQTGNVVFEMRDEYRTGDEIEELAKAFTDVSHKTMEYVKKIMAITAEKERIGAELSVATQIQEDMLPNIFPPYPERKEFDLIASMNPAKEVGGDFYDFYMIDHDHLGVTIADVSGKGVPAALFMVISKTLLKNYALMGASPKEVLEYVNHQLCQSNKADMFVTVWIAKIELSTGKVVAANAGHEFPAIKRSDGSFELFKDRHGFVVGGMDGISYKEYSFKLEKGDSFFVYTDGVAEANNVNNELFGTDRMIEALNRHSDDDMSDFLVGVRSDIDSFVGEAPQFDDITMLYFRYYGPSGNTSYIEKKATYEASVDNITAVTEFVDTILGNIGCAMKTMKQINVAIDEIFSNIALYAYEEGETGDCVVRVRYKSDYSQVTLLFEDRGKEYDPLEKEDPDITLSAEEREIGGLGIFITKKLMDEVAYSRRDGKNILKLVKSLK